MRKYVSYLCACMLLLSMLSPASFAITDDIPAEEVEFRLIQAEANVTEMEFSDGSVIPLGQLEIDLSDANAVDNALTNPNLTKEVKDSISEKAQFVAETGTELKLTVLSSELLPMTRSTSQKYYTYNGAQMRSDFIYVSNLDTGYQTVASGAAATEFAKNATDLTLRQEGTSSYQSRLSISKTIKLIQGFANLLKAYESYYETVNINGAQKDYVQIAVVYDKVEQYTYREMTQGAGDFRLGATTMRVYVERYDVRCSFIGSITGNRNVYEYNDSPSLNFNTKNYDSPWALAYNHAGAQLPADEYVVYDVGTKTLIFETIPNFV